MIWLELPSAIFAVSIYAPGFLSGVCTVICCRNGPVAAPASIPMPRLAGQRIPMLLLNQTEAQIADV